MNNPYKLGERVHDWSVLYKSTTSIMHGINVTAKDLKWNTPDDDESDAYLTLLEIFTQVLEMRRGTIMEGEIPFLRVCYEEGAWGVIYEVGNWQHEGSQWFVHGITKGYL